MKSRHIDGAGKRALWWSVGATLLSVIVIAAGLLFWVYKEKWAGIHRGINAAAPWLTLWRLIYFAIAIGGWPLWVQRLSQRYQWDADHTQRIQRLRWPIAGWLTLIELVIGQHVLDRMLA